MSTSLLNTVARVSLALLPFGLLGLPAAAAPESGCSGLQAASVSSEQLGGQQARQGLASLESGEQRILTGLAGSWHFAGHEIDFDGFTGIAGFGSQAAYLLVIEGEARLGDKRAVSGQMLLIPPFGDPPSVARFDAARLKEAYSGQPGQMAQPVMAALDELAGRQARYIWLGRLGRTSFNVAAAGPGGAEAELARRSLVDNAAVRALRFSSCDDPTALESGLVSQFAEGLRDGDVETLASFLDPTPFGGTDLRGGALAAREVAARQLLDRADWAEALSDLGDPQGEPGLWRVPAGEGELIVYTRPVDEFVFVNTVTFQPKS